MTCLRDCAHVRVLVNMQTNASTIREFMAKDLQQCEALKVTRHDFYPCGWRFIPDAYPLCYVLYGKHRGVLFPNITSSMKKPYSLFPKYGICTKRYARSSYRCSDSVLRSVVPYKLVRHYCRRRLQTPMCHFVHRIGDFKYKVQHFSL